MIRRWRSNPGILALDVLLVLTLVFLFLPLVVVFPVSITPSSYFRFPPDGFSLRWYEDFAGNEQWHQTAWLSLRLAVASTLASTALGLAAALATTRMLRRGVSFVRALLLTPIVVPVVILAAALLHGYEEIHLATRNTFFGLMVGHTLLGLPFTFIILESTLRTFDVALEDVAIGLGASRVAAFRRITLPIVFPGIIAAAAFAFVASWDDVVVAAVVGNFRTQTLPLRMLEFMTTQIRPTTAAISSTLITALAAGMLAYQLASRQRWRRGDSSRDQVEE